MVQTAVTFQELEHRQAELRDAAELERDQYPDVLHFLQDFLPQTHARVLDCDAAGRLYRDEMAGDRWKTTPESCWKIPWCIFCTRRRHMQRVFKALTKFQRCTPEGKQPRFIHVVQTAPITEDGRGWGVSASYNHAAFSDIVWQSCRDAMGTGVGGITSYQDFGERAFGKRHPHIDMTLNGWMLGPDGAAVKTPWPFENGQSKWIKATLARATRFDVTASDFGVNVRANRPAEGIRTYFRGLAYQMRELVDVRKIQYDRAGKRVLWNSYRDGTVEEMTVQQFLRGLRDYQSRLGYWDRGAAEAQQLHREKGHMARSQIGRTEATMGSVLPDHPESCICAQCGAWRREYIRFQEDPKYAF